MNPGLRPLTEYPGVDVSDIDTMDLEALFKLLPPQHIADCLGSWVSKVQAKPVAREEEVYEPRAS